MFTVTQSCHDQPCIQIKNPTDREREILVSTVQSQSMSDPRYEVSKKAGAFLQCNYSDYILVEFWTKDYQPFVDFVNQELERR